MIEYGERKGDIWQIFFYTKKKVQVSDKDKQNFMDSQTREMNNTFDPPPGLSPDAYSNLFLNHFMKARQSSQEMIEKNSEVKIRNGSQFQVGNQECLDDLLKIETSPDFHSWENPTLVDYFRKISESNL
jgi:hypothetical protein